MRALAALVLLTAVGAATAPSCTQPRPAPPGGQQATVGQAPDFLDRPLAWASNLGSYYIDTTSSPNGAIPALRTPPEPTPTTLGGARDRIAAAAPSDWTLKWTHDHPALLVGADLSALRRAVQSMNLRPAELRALYEQESDEDLRRTYLLALGFSFGVDSIAAETERWWLDVATGWDHPVPQRAGAAIFSAIRVRPELCAKIRHRLVQDLLALDSDAEARFRIVHTALAAATGAVRDPNNTIAVLALLDWIEKNTERWSTDTAYALGRSSGADPWALLSPGTDSWALIAAEPARVLAWPYFQGPELIPVLTLAAFEEEGEFEQGARELHARLYLAGQYERAPTQALRALETIESGHALRFALEAGGYARPELAVPIVELLRAGSGLREVRDELARELLALTSQVDRAVLPLAEERRARNALRISGFRPDEDGRFGRGVEAWLDQQLPPE